jgi:hypothetical protein
MPTMEIVYKQSFAQFVDSYLATYYSSGIKTFSRTAGGPLQVFIAILLIINARNPNTWRFFQIVFWLLSAYLLLKGVLQTIQPAIDVFLVWLRKDTIIEENLPIHLKLDVEKEHIAVTNGDKDPLNFLLADIKSIQHRKTSAWILSTTDFLLYIPRTGLISGNHDAFIQAVEAVLIKNEQKY